MNSKTSIEETQALFNLKRDALLNDSSINFIGSEIIKHNETEKYILLIDPIFVNCYEKSKIDHHNQRGTFGKVLNKEHLEKYKIILFPVHSETVSKISGRGYNIKHWSLLVYYTQRKYFVHYDSLNHTNDESAEILVKMLYLHHKGVVNIDTNLFTCDFPTQDSDWQCGLVVLRLIKRISIDNRSLKNDDHAIEVNVSDLKEDFCKSKSLLLFKKDLISYLEQSKLK